MQEKIRFTFVVSFNNPHYRCGHAVQEMLTKEVSWKEGGIYICPDTPYGHRYLESTTPFCSKRETFYRDVKYQRETLHVPADAPFAEKATLIWEQLEQIRKKLTDQKFYFTSTGFVFITSEKNSNFEEKLCWALFDGTLGDKLYPLEKRAYKKLQEQLPTEMIGAYKECFISELLGM